MNEQIIQSTESEQEDAPTVPQSIGSQKFTNLTENDIKNALLKMMRGRKSTVKHRGYCKGAFGKK